MNRFIWRWVVPGLLGTTVVSEIVQAVTRGFKLSHGVVMVVSGGLLALSLKLRRGAVHYSWMIPVGVVVTLSGVILVCVGALTRPWYDPINVLAGTALFVAIRSLWFPETEPLDRGDQAEAVARFTDIVNTHGPDSLQAEEFLLLYVDDKDTLKLFHTVLRLVRDRRATSGA